MFQCAASLLLLFLFLSYNVVLPYPVIHGFVFLFPFSVFIHPVFQLVCVFHYSVD